MSIVFYQTPMSSATPVTWALGELGVPHDKVHVDLKAGDQRKPEFLRLNPNGKVPTLVVDGTPMFEGLAIMLLLADRYGVERQLWPAPQAPARLEAMSWSVWAYVSYGSALSRLFMATSQRLGSEYHNAAQAEYMRKELTTLQSALNGRLAERPYLLGENFSIADVIVASLIGFGAFSGVPVDDHPHLKMWLENCQARPAYKASMAS